MKMIIIMVLASIAIQIAFIMVNVKISIEIVSNWSWWVVFSPSLILAVIAGILILFFSVINVQ